MKNCPNCGALINDDQTTCSVCNTAIFNDINQSNNQQPNIFINSISNDSEQENKVYEPLPNTETNNKDEEKANVMTNILKEHEEKNNNQPQKDNSFKSALLSIIVVIAIIVIGFFGVKFGFNKINNGDDKIINEVVNQANNYTNIIKNYMKKFDYKTNQINLNGYYAKSRTNSFLSIPLSGKCIFKDGKWIGSDEEEISCEKFFNDINNNYCSTVPCDIPSEAEIYLKETYETMKINDSEETITTGTISDGSTLTYDDIICSLSNGNYSCNYKEK